MLPTTCHICLILRIVNDLLYTAGQLNSDNLAGNQFINFTLVALTELPACFIGQFMIDRLGRRWSHVICMLGSAIPQVIIIGLLSQSDTGSAINGLVITGRIFSNIAWYVMWIQAMEILPTDVRGTGTNITGLIGACIGLSAPYITMLVSD